eukprot:TRINITY_DN67067_c1_g1_i1.p1 TRINITY_DN67067_c1_g1~~TRINITY_DN67067_c1_g1_i1.p1  ORF type:complete len:346 (-),score=31.45 TRINITY_DN67067_c1_g1_i1:911-1948(-)
MDLLGMVFADHEPLRQLLAPNAPVKESTLRLKEDNTPPPPAVWGRGRGYIARGRGRCRLGMPPMMGRGAPGRGPPTIAAPPPASKFVSPADPPVRQQRALHSSSASKHAPQPRQQASSRSPPPQSSSSRPARPASQQQPACSQPLKLPKNVQLVFHTTCIITPPKRQWTQFVEIKKQHLLKKIKRPPYPHITLIAPFVAPNSFELAAKVLRQKLQDVQPFKLSFKKFKMFTNPGNSATLYLEPEEGRPGALKQLHEACINILPDPDEARYNFEPHIGVGFWPDAGKAATDSAKYQSQWTPMDYECREVYFLSRSGADTPWEFKHVIPIGPRVFPPMISVGETTAS